METQIAIKMKLIIRSIWSCGSKHRFHSVIKVFGLLALFTFPLSAGANVNSVTASPSQRNIQVKGSSSFSVTWQVTRTEATAPGTVTVSSSSASLVINGSTVASLGSTLSKTSTLSPAESETLTFSEIISLTPALARRIAAASAGTVFIRRTFSDTQTTDVGQVSLFAGANNSGALDVRRIDLHFENNSRTEIFRVGEIKRAIAEVNFASSGLLKGEWRIIDPTASLGSATGRVLQVVRRQLTSSGEGRTTISSPPLPTRKNGLYLITFAVEDAEEFIEIPVLRYFVLEGTSPEGAENLSVLSPGDGARLTRDTVFSWRSTVGALAYQIEIFEPGIKRAVTGKVVPGKELKLRLSSFSCENLNSGEIYDWRLRAFDRQGRVIGSSPRKSLVIP